MVVCFPPFPSPVLPLISTQQSTLKFIMSEPTTDVEKRPPTHPSTSDSSVSHDDPQFDTPDAHIGVKKVEAAAKIYRGRAKWFLYLGYVVRCPLLPPPRMTVWLCRNAELPLRRTSTLLMARPPGPTSPGPNPPLESTP